MGYSRLSTSVEMSGVCGRTSPTAILRIGRVGLGPSISRISAVCHVFAQSRCERSRMDARETKARSVVFVRCPTTVFLFERREMRLFTSSVAISLSRIATVFRKDLI